MGQKRLIPQIESPTWNSIFDLRSYQVRTMPPKNTLDKPHYFANRSRFGGLFFGPESGFHCAMDAGLERIIRQALADARPSLPGSRLVRNVAGLGGASCPWWPGDEGRKCRCRSRLKRSWPRSRLAAF